MHGIWQREWRTEEWERRGEERRGEEGEVAEEEQKELRAPLHASKTFLPAG